MQRSLFSAEESNKAIWYVFKNSRWGRLYDSLPWESLEACLPAIKRGPCPHFSRKGKFALMFPRGVRSNMSWEFQMKR